MLNPDPFVLPAFSPRQEAVIDFDSSRWAQVLANAGAFDGVAFFHPASAAEQPHGLEQPLITWNCLGVSSRSPEFLAGFAAGLNRLVSVDDWVELSTAQADSLGDRSLRGGSISAAARRMGQGPDALMVVAWWIEPPDLQSSPSVAVRMKQTTQHAWSLLWPLLAQAWTTSRAQARAWAAVQQSLARQHWLEQALCFAREVVWELDVKTRSLRYSRYVAALDRPRGDDLPMTLDDFIASLHPLDRAPVMQLMDDYLEGEQPECYFEYRQRHQDGHWIWSRSRGRAMRRDAQGRPLLVLGTAVGITLQKNLEQSLRESELALRISDHQLREREGELRAALALAEQAALSRAQFLATMSHEIRTPLNSIIGASRLALMETDHQSVKEHLALVNDASGLLMNLVNSILDHSRLQAGAVALELQPLSLGRLMHDVVRQQAPAAAARQLSLDLRLDTKLPAAVQADALRLTQVLTNLLANALRFTHVGGVELGAEVVTTLGDISRVRFSVRDSGIGMTPQQCERLFQAYSQADRSIARRYGGTGLGLAISHRLVELMGGELTVQSQPDIGSVFAFEIPLKVAVLHEAAEVVGTGPAGSHQPRVQAVLDRLKSAAVQLQGRRVLVVDDNPMNLLVARQFLQKAGLEVETASSPVVALDRLEQVRFDAVLMDLYMPEMNGADATRQIRSRPHLSLLPVLALSASVTPEERQLCRDAGMNDFIAKPLDPEQLLAALTRLIPPQPHSDQPADRKSSKA